MEERFGFIHDKLDIKILILYILQRLFDPVDLDTLAVLTLCDGGITYFDFAECLAELVQTGHVEETESGYKITEKGRRNGKITESGLPYSVRVKAEKGTSRIAAIQKRNAMIQTSRAPLKKGAFDVHLSMEDGYGPIISINLIAGNEEQAAIIEQNFQKNAEEIYGKIMDILVD